jgi:putative ATP-binding cassette transporter
MSMLPKSALQELFVLLRPFKYTVRSSIVLGIVGGLSITILLATIWRAAQRERPQPAGRLALRRAVCTGAVGLYPV